MRLPVRSASSVLALLAVFGSAITPANAQAPYEGRTVTLVVGGDSGGGYDIYGRALARHIGRHLPGKPIIIVQNRPGAGSVTAAEYIYAIAPKDGMTFAIIFPGAIIEPLLGGGHAAAVRYDATKFEYLGTADNTTRVCATYHTAKVRTMEQAKATKVMIGATASGGSTRDYAYMLNAMTGTQFSVVAGYKGTNDITLALERGEVDGLCGFDWSSLKSQKPEWLSDRRLNVLVQVALEPEPELSAMGVPHLLSMVSGETRKVAEMIVTQQVFGRPFVAPPGTPADRVALLRAAFMAAMVDLEFLADAGKMRIQVSPLAGDVVQARVRDLYATPKAIVEQAKLALKPPGG
jgi:tripartite-type tricarboxylate transporter receptor subunit TctC